MLIERIVTHLEMFRPDQLETAVPVPGMTLGRWNRSLELLISTHDHIARPHRWPSLQWDLEYWQYRTTDRKFSWFEISWHGDIAGVLELEEQPGGQVEITIFGLLPELQGRGLGAYALTLCVNQAWATQTGGESPQRVWLHTSTRDGPNALVNYQRRGFSAFATETKTEEL